MLKHMGFLKTRKEMDTIKERLEELSILLSSTALENDENELYDKVLVTFGKLFDCFDEIDKLKKEFVQKELLEEEDIDVYLK